MTLGVAAVTCQCAAEADEVKPETPARSAACLLSQRVSLSVSYPILQIVAMSFETEWRGGKTSVKWKLGDKWHEEVVGRHGEGGYTVQQGKQQGLLTYNHSTHNTAALQILG
jgi:hypothetical protein